MSIPPPSPHVEAAFVFFPPSRTRLPPDLDKPKEISFLYHVVLRDAFLFWGGRISFFFFVCAFFFFFWANAALDVILLLAKRATMFCLFFSAGQPTPTFPPLFCWLFFPFFRGRATSARASAPGMFSPPWRRERVLSFSFVF